MVSQNYTYQSKPGEIGRPVNLKNHNLIYGHTMDSLCLADLCDIFGCKQFHFLSSLNLGKNYPEQEISVSVFNQRDFYRNKTVWFKTMNDTQRKVKSKTEKRFMEYDEGLQVNEYGGNTFFNSSLWFKITKFHNSFIETMYLYDPKFSVTQNNKLMLK